MSDIVSIVEAPPRPFVALATAQSKPGQTVPSPCVNVCRMSPTSGLCEGCWRTLEELRAWAKSDDAAKLAIWGQVEARQLAAGVART
jgi:uncharacterized protein